MKKKELVDALGSVGVFASPKVSLEQYATGADVGADLLHTADLHFHDLQHRLVADLGAGSGVLTIGAALLGAHVIGFELDSDALEVCRENVVDFHLSGSIDLVQSDVTHLVHNPALRNAFDTVVMNPPFGTKHNKGIDMVFLQTGLTLASGAVYSLHKSSTREHILKKAKEWKVKVEVLGQFLFDLPATYRFHKNQSLDIDVDFYRFSNIHNFEPKLSSLS